MQEVNATTQSLALVGGIVIDGSGKDPLPDATILIRGERVEAVGRSRDLPLPRDCRTIDVTGKTVLPGLIDAHVHLYIGRTNLWPDQGLEGPLALIAVKAFARARRALEMGFTTLRDAGDMGDIGVSIRDAINGGFVEGPRVLACGLYISATSGHGNALPRWLTRNDIASPVADGVTELIKAVRSQVWMNTDWIKFCATGGGSMNTWDEQQFNDAEIQAIVDEAHLKGRPVAAHCIQAKGTLAAVKAGVDTVEHGMFLTEEICDRMIQKGIWLVPTLSAPAAVVQHGAEYGITPDRVEACRPTYDAQKKSIRMALDKGVQVACGTDAGIGPVIHGNSAYELELLVASGMTPMQAIVTATGNSARALRLADRLGTLEAGKLADLVVVDGDPLQDIRVLQDRERIVLVAKGGAICVDRRGGA